MAAASRWELHTHTVNAYCFYQNVFDSDQIDGIIQAGDKEVLMDAQIGGDFSEPGKVVEDVRKTKISWIPSTEDNAWMFRIRAASSRDVLSTELLFDAYLKEKRT